MNTKNKKNIAFFEAGSWYHRIKVLQEDGTTKYSKRGGFKTAEEANESYRKYEEEYIKSYRNYHVIASTEFEFRDYLIWWLDEIYTPRIENTTRMLATYVLYDLILPNMVQGIKLRYINVEYLNALLVRVSRSCESAGNKCRELLNIALKDAVLQGHITNNPIPSTKPYKRKKPTIIVLNKEQLRLFLEKAAKNNWYLEILMGLFLGLRKGEIAGLKYADFNIEKEMVTISRQITSNPIIQKGGSKIEEYQVIEKPPKTQNSYRTLRVPHVIIEEVIKRKKQNDYRKELLGNNYMDKDYLSCCKNGLPHAVSSFNTALTKLCRRSGLPHLTVHSLRHMYASILLEQGVPLVKISALLGHASVSTTFEYYCEILDEYEEIRGFMNNNFVPRG
jgi:integrase